MIKKTVQPVIVIDKYGREKLNLSDAKLIDGDISQITSGLNKSLSSDAHVSPQVYLLNELKLVDFSGLTSKSHIIDAIKKGFKPVHYIVFGLVKPKYSYESAKFDATLIDIRNKMFALLYGSRWRKYKDRARAVGGLELGKYKRKPHINLLIEELPKEFSSKRIDDLFNIQLPLKVMGVLMKDAIINPFYSDDVTGYMSKEFHHQFPTIHPLLTDKF